MLAAKLAAMEDLPEPWPHSICDDFLPMAAYLDLLGIIGEAWDGCRTPVRKTRSLPASVIQCLSSPDVMEALRARWGFQGGKPQIELAFRAVPLAPHVDRCDKLWSGLIYVAGDPRGTELYGPDHRLAKVVDWRPNRLVAWTRPPKNQQHAVPKSSGRYVLAWWILN